jgi:hypothetical protein
MIGPFDPDAITHLGGLRVCTDSMLTETKVERRQERFVEYGPEDDWWLLRYFPERIRHVQVPKREAYRIDDVLVMHPALWDEMKREMERRN